MNYKIGERVLIVSNDVSVNSNKIVGRIVGINREMYVIEDQDGDFFQVTEDEMLPICDY